MHTLAALFPVSGIVPSPHDAGDQLFSGDSMNKELIKKALTKWADKIDYVISDWAMDQWLDELENTGKTDEELMLHMKYMLELGRPPNLNTLLKSIESGLPETYWAKLIPEDERAMFIEYWGELNRACSYASIPKRMWAEIHKVILKYKNLRPDLDWGPHEREAYEKSQLVDKEGKKLD